MRNTFRLNAPRTLRRKLCEFYGARILNAHYTKEEILERYLNRLSFGGLTYGFQSAAQYYFARDIQQLTKAEQLALITIAKNATMYHPLTHPEAFRTRFLALSDALYQQGLLTKEEVRQLNEESLTFLTHTHTDFNYVTDFLKRYYLNNDLTLATTTLLATDALSS
jgi:membrane peptidoglycan carboxypeptidase